MDDRLAGWEKACAAGFYAEVIRGVLAVAASEQFAIVLYTPQLGPTGDRTPLELFEVNQGDGAIVDGILITDPEARRLERSELPVVSLDYPRPPATHPNPACTEAGDGPIRSTAPKPQL